MMQLVWWSLAEYDHVPVVSAARKGMCKQMTELMLSQWHRNGHICKTLTSFTAYYLQRYDIRSSRYSNLMSCRVVSSGENFSPKKNATECTGTKFYHWGALGGLITLLEEGLYY
jgi:hypothetical protein